LSEKLYKISRDIFAEVFPPEVREIFRASESKEVLLRLEIIEACGPEPSDSFKQGHLRNLRKRKAAWETYLRAAFVIGLFHGPSGKDLLSRLRSTNEANFRSGMAECMVAWFLTGKLGFELEPRPLGKETRTLEFLIKRPDGNNISTEVKAPCRIILDDTRWGDDSDLLQDALKKANQQFRKGVLNLLAIVPSFSYPIYYNRRQLTRAFFGNSAIEIPIDERTIGPTGPIKTVFIPSGHFFESRLPSGKPFKPDGSPRFTRISAVLCIEETPQYRGMDHYALLVHNPFAVLHIQEDIWDNIPQFVERSGNMVWTDGADPWM
jgi:hypothetical protein